MDNISVLIKKIESFRNKVVFSIAIDSSLHLFPELFRFTLSDFEETFEGKKTLADTHGTTYSCVIEFLPSKRFLQFNDGVLRTTVSGINHFYNVIYSYENTEFIKYPSDDVTCYFDDDDIFDNDELEENILTSLIKKKDSDKIFSLLKLLSQDYRNEEKVNSFLNTVFFNHIHFLPSQMADLADMITDPAFLSIFVLNVTKPYSYEDLIALSPYVNTHVFEKLATYSRINLFQDSATVRAIFEDILYYDDSKAEAYLRNAHNKGIQFDPGDVLELAQTVSSKLTYELALNSTYYLSKAQLEELEDLMEDNHYLKLRAHYHDKGVYEIKRNIKSLCGYSDEWFTISLDSRPLSFTSNTNELFVEPIFEYKSYHGNILLDVEFYITSTSGSIIKPDGFLTGLGSLPDRIDIRMDAEEHTLKFGPTFPIKGDDPRVIDGLAFNFVFKDMASKYIVRKTFILFDGDWHHEELLALKL